MVGDAGVDVHPARVPVGVHVVAQVRGLRVLAEPGVVVRGAGRLHRAQRHPLHAGREQAGADQPVGVAGVLAQRVLLHQRAEDVGERFVEGAGLAAVVQPGGELGDAVREFVADDVQAGGEVAEDDAVPVAEHHPLPVPERVVVVVPVVDGRLQAQPGAVDRGPAVHLGEERVRRAEAVVRVVDGLVVDGSGALGAHRAAGQPLGVPGVADDPLRPGRAGGRDARQQAGLAVHGVDGERADGRQVTLFGEPVEDVGRDDRAERGG